MHYLDEWAREYNIDIEWEYSSDFRFGVAGSCRGLKRSDDWRTRYGFIRINAKLRGKSSE